MVRKEEQRERTCWDWNPHKANTFRARIIKLCGKNREFVFSTKIT
jgi:hypothetical protein